MFPENALCPPYYHSGLDEKTAKELVRESKSGNFLFCQGPKPEYIILVYKAFFRGNEEVRTTRITYTANRYHLSNQGSFITSNDHKHFSLYAVAQYLKPFLQEYISSPFEPVPVVPLGISEEQVIAAEKEYAAMYEEHLAQTKEIQEKVKIIWDAIHKQIPPTSEGKPKISNRLDYNGYSIHSPTEYSAGEILVKIASRQNPEDTLVFLSRTNIRIAGCSYGSTLFEDQTLLDKLIEVCEQRQSNSDTSSMSNNF